MLDHHQLQALHEALQRLYVHADAETFPTRILEAVVPLIPSAIACYTELRPGTDHVRNVADHQDDGLDALLPVLGELPMQHPRIRDYIENGQQAALTTSDYLSQRDWHARELFQHFYGAMGLDEQLAIMMPAEADTHLGLVFNRERRTFTAAERQMLDLLRPHVAIAFANARAVSELKAATEAAAPREPRHGLVRLTRDGRMRYATQRALAMLSRHWPTPSGTTELPAAVQSWLRRIAKPAGADTRQLRHTSVHGELTLRLIEDVEVPGWLLLLEERVRLDRQPLDVLAPRLRRIAEQMLRGGSEQEVAEQLQLSVHTVHEYMKQIYRRVGVHSRAELMARLQGRR